MTEMYTICTVIQPPTALIVGVINPPKRKGVIVHGGVIT